MLVKNKGSRVSRQAIDAEVEALANAGLLDESLIDTQDGSKDLRRAYARAREAVQQACLCGDWYKQREESSRPARLDNEQFETDAKKLQRQLQVFGDRYARRRFPLIIDSSGKTSWAGWHIYALIEHFTQIARQPKPPKNSKTGNPSNPWLLGFIWRMAVGWRELSTKANISSALAGRFFRFVQAGLISTKPDRLAELEPTVIKTAIKRFDMKGRKWLRPVEEGGGKNPPRKFKGF